MRRLPPLNAVRAFEAAARHGNFTRAAEELGMTQAAVSYQIKLIEERLGTPLFSRDKKRVVLTEAGRKAAPLVSSAFDTLDEAFAIARRENEAVLTVSSSQTFASNWLARNLGRFQVSRPELALRLHTSDELVDFARDEVDVAVRVWRDGRPPGVASHFLLRIHATPMCSPECRDRMGGLAEPGDLLDVNQLSPHDDWWERWFALAGISITDRSAAPGLRLDGQVFDGVAAMEHQGVAMLSPALWRSDMAAGRLVQLFPLILFEPFSYWLVYPEHKRNAPKVKAFREWLLGEIARQAELDDTGAFVAPSEAE
jgi:LysR family transcriptional regulator, glycine cleavage system transcriptional activator